MEITEIVLLAAGGIIFILSFLIPDKKGEISEQSRTLVKGEIADMVSNEMESIKGQVDGVVEEAVTYAMEKTERSLERLSNEKIMAVSEYSDTVLAEIHKNHEEAMFLYDMLNSKHGSLKETVAAVDRTVKEVEERVNGLVVMTGVPEVPMTGTAAAGQSMAASRTAVRPAVVSPAASVPASSMPSAFMPSASMPMTSVPASSMPSASMPAASMPMTSMSPASMPVSSAPELPQPPAPQSALARLAAAQARGSKAQTSQPTASVPVTSIPSTSIPVTSMSPASISSASVPVSVMPQTVMPVVSDGRVSFLQERAADGRNNNERILELYSQGKSKVAIAKELGLGVGEVKLVIDLFKNQ